MTAANDRTGGLKSVTRDAPSQCEEAGSLALFT